MCINLFELNTISPLGALELIIKALFVVPVCPIVVVGEVEDRFIVFPDIVTVSVLASPKVVFPLTVKVLFKVVSPVTPKVPSKFVFPVTLKVELEILLEAEIIEEVRALTKVVAPVTPKVPPTVAELLILKSEPDIQLDAEIFEAVKAPLIIVFPFTSSRASGDVVPMPTLPLLLIYR